MYTPEMIAAEVEYRSNRVKESTRGQRRRPHIRIPRASRPADIVVDAR